LYCENDYTTIYGNSQGYEAGNLYRIKIFSQGRFFIPDFSLEKVDSSPKGKAGNPPCHPEPKVNVPVLPSCHPEPKVKDPPIFKEGDSSVANAPSE